MKLSSLKQTLSEALPLIRSLSYATQAQNYRFTNVKSFKKGVELASLTGVFEKEISAIKSHSVYESTLDVIITNAVDGKALKDRAVEMSKSVELLLRSLKNLVLDDATSEENVVYVKLPNTTNLADLSKDIRIFNKILSNTIINEKIGGQVTLENVEPGSVWLKIKVGSFLAVSVVGSLAWASAVIYKKYQEGQVIEEIVNQQKLDNEHKKNLIEASKTLTNLMIEAEAINIYNTYYENGQIDQEQIERIKLSIKMLSEEIKKGAEINPALTAPEEVTNLFPDMKSLPGIESKIKRLEK